MTSRTIAHARLRNSRLVGPPLATPEEVVRWFGAVQSQDVPGALWGIAQRLSPEAARTLDGLGAAMDDGRIVRTHALRPTWHFLVPDELRWIEALTGPRVQRANDHVGRRRLGIDRATFDRSNRVIRAALSDGGPLTRDQLRAALVEAGVPFTDPNTLSHVLMNAELEALICNGPRRGKQATYALVDERVPPVPSLAAGEALRRLTIRYFTSHGPALAHDMAWWSGLTVGAVREGIALAGDALEGRRIDDRDCWAAAEAIEPEPGLVPDGHLLLLPNYDEYLGSYADYSPIFDDALPRARTVADVLGTNLVVRDGLVVGGWRRRLDRDRVTVTATLLVPFSAADRVALEAAADSFGRFLRLPVELRVVAS